MCNQPRKHAAVIKAWADGAEVQSRPSDGHAWRDVEGPAFHANWQYRIKSEPTDLDKYGVEAGDIWASAKVELHSIKRKHSMFAGVWIATGGYPLDQSALKVLVFRCGVVNKLGEV